MKPSGVNAPVFVATTAAIATAEISGAVTPTDCAMSPRRPTALRRSPRPPSGAAVAGASITPPADAVGRRWRGLRSASHCGITSHMAGRESSLRERLREGRLVGTFVKLPALESIELCAAELDFAVVDLEHSQLSEADALRLVRHAYALGFPAVARIPEVDRGLVNRLLEAGAGGVHLSSVCPRAD